MARMEKKVETRLSSMRGLSFFFFSPAYPWDYACIIKKTLDGGKLPDVIAMGLPGLHRSRCLSGHCIATVDLLLPEDGVLKVISTFQSMQLLCGGGWACSFRCYSAHNLSHASSRGRASTHRHRLLKITLAGMTLSRLRVGSEKEEAAPTMIAGEAENRQ